jgi:predicted AAA+ superfamily ATPase
MDQRLTELLVRVAEALERLAPPPVATANLAAEDAFVWHPSPPHLSPVAKVSRVDIALLQGVERQKQILIDNTLRFARGLPANNAMLWGARGMGKSSLVKAVHEVVNRQAPGSLALVEIHREDVRSLPELLNVLRSNRRRFLILCDDLSFEREDSDYKALKSILEGGIEGRHLMPRDMIENERSTAINPAEAIEEKVSLSDRFGLWLGFHNCDQDTFFAMVDGYAASMRLPIESEALHAEAIEWSMTRGARSGRVAWQFIQDLAGRLGVKLS